MAKTLTSDAVDNAPDVTLADVVDAPEPLRARAACSRALSPGRAGHARYAHGEEVARGDPSAGRSLWTIRPGRVGPGSAGARRCRERWPCTSPHTVPDRDRR